MAGGRPKGWGFRILVSLDQLANTLALGNPDETLSSRAQKARERGKAWGCVLCGLLDLIDRDHCLRAVERDEA